MISLKKTTKSIMIGIVIFIFIAFSINFFLVPITKGYIEKSDAHLKSLNSEILSMDLPAKVLSNVLAQVTNDISNKSNIKLLEAFDSNQKTLYLLAQSVESEFVNYQGDMVFLDKLSLTRHEAIVKQIQNKVLDLKMSSARIDELVRGSDIDSTPIEIIKSYTQKIT